MFGMYLRIDCEPVLQWPGEPWFGFTPRFWVGPLSERIIDLETLANRGPRITRVDVYEKSCQHDYVAGSIVNVMPPTGLTDPLHFGGDMGTCSAEVPTSAAFDAQRLPAGPGETTYFTGTTPEGWTLDSGYRIVRWGQYPTSGWDSPGPRMIVVVASLSLTAEGYRRGSWWFYIIMDLKEDPRTGRQDLCNFRVYIDPLSGYPMMYKCAINSTLGNPISVSPERRGIVDLAGISDWIKSEVGPSRPRGRYSNTARDEAIYEALENIAVSNINPLELFRDLRDPKKVFTTVFEPLKYVSKTGKSPVSLVKLLASLHLWWKYFLQIGVMTLTDLRGVARFVWERQDALMAEIRNSDLQGRGRHDEETGSDMFGKCSRTYTAKVVYRFPGNSVDGWLDTLNILGFTPRLSDLWDIVPYSFALDWVISIENVVERLELNSISQRMPLCYAVLGDKIEWDYSTLMSDGVQTLSVNLVGVEYDRGVVDELPTDMWFGKVFQDPRKHLATGGALLVQYLAK